MRQVVDSKDKSLREASGRLFVLIGIAFDLLKNLFVRVGRRDLPLDLGGLEGSLIFEKVELLRARLGVDLVDLLPFLEEHAVHANVGLDPDRVVVDQMALAYGAVVLVAVDEIFEVGHRVQCGSSGQANLDGVEVIECVTPRGQLLWRCSHGDIRRERSGRRRGLGCQVVWRRHPQRPRPQGSTAAWPKRLMVMR